MEAVTQAMAEIENCERTVNLADAKIAYIELGRMLCEGCPSIRIYRREAIKDYRRRPRDFAAENIGLHIFASQTVNFEFALDIDIEPKVMAGLLAEIEACVEKWDRNGAVRAYMELGKACLKRRAYPKKMTDRQVGRVVEEGIGLHFFILHGVHGKIMPDQMTNLGVGGGCRQLCLGFPRGICFRR